MSNRSHLAKIEKECEQCGDAFTPNSYTQKFCGEACRRAAREEQKAKRRSTRKKRGCIYIARDCNNPDRLKIGLSRFPEKRVKKLDTEAEVIHTIKTFDQYNVEEKLHERFANSRDVGEWFTGLQAEHVQEVAESLSLDAEDVGVDDYSDTPEPPYNASEVADILDRSVEFVCRNLREGQLDGKKWSNEWIVTDKALREWLGDELFEIHFASDTEA